MMRFSILALPVDLDFSQKVSVNACKHDSEKRQLLFVPFSFRVSSFLSAETLK